MAGRMEVVDRLLAAHEAWFDVERDHRFAGRVFSGYAEFALDDLVSFMTGEALAKVQLTSDHMSSYLSLVVVADRVDEAVPALVRRARFRKNFAFGLKGWADMRVAVVDLSARRVWANTQGKPLVETLAANAFAEGALAEGGKGASVAAGAGGSAADVEAPGQRRRP